MSVDNVLIMDSKLVPLSKRKPSKIDTKQLSVARKNLKKMMGSALMLAMKRKGTTN